MAKISDSYKSLSRGVSQQTPERRLDGQHTEQINTISDPVRGLTRRQGSVLVREALASTSAGALAQINGYVSRDISLESTDLTVLYSPTSSGTPADPFYVFNRATGERYNLSTDSLSALRTVLANGVSGMTAAGRFLLLSGNNYVTQSSNAPLWTEGQSLPYPLAVYWIKGGAYSRTYTIKIRTGAGTTYTASISTPASSYQENLYIDDLSPVIPDPANPGETIPNPEYSNQILERTTEYNTAVTQWIGIAAGFIQPDVIAGNLLNALAAVVPPGTFILSRMGSHILVAAVSGTTITGVDLDDGGDGSLVQAVLDTVADPSQLTKVHYSGRVIKVAPAGKTAYYVRAVGLLQPQNPLVSQEVRWEECGADLLQPTVAFVLATIQGGTLYASTTPAGLTSLGVTNVPTFGRRNAGDSDSNPGPYWLGRKIDYLGFFQDRLVVGSGSVLSFSKVGDYFNFFKDSALTTVDSDAAEGYAIGSEADTVRRSVIFDKSLLLFGDRQQYTVSGRVPVTPATLTIMQSSAHSDATRCWPITAGDLVFYGKSVEDATQVFQIQIGNVDDTSNSTEVTQQLDDYIVGYPVQMVGLSLPDCIVVRSSGKPNSVYLFRYIDQGAERVLDSWSRWDFDPAMGNIVGLSVHLGMLRLLFARGVGNNTYVAFEECSVRGSVPDRPFLDSLRRSTATAPAIPTSVLKCAFEADHPTAALQGDSAANSAALLADFPGTSLSELWFGVPFESSTTLTSPVVKDRNGAPITTGRTTVQSLSISYDNTSGFAVDVAVESQGTRRVLDFNARIVSALSNLVGVVPQAKGRVVAFIGQDTTRYEATLRSRSWLPSTFTNIEWVGQIFNNVRRA